MADCDELSYAAFHEWFELTFVALLREILDDAIENLDPGRADLNGRLERFRDVLISDATIVSLYEDATDVYAATGEDQAGLKLHLTESLSTGLPTRFQTTDAKTQERSQLPTGEWVAGALILLDLGFYDFWLFDRIDANEVGSSLASKTTRTSKSSKNCAPGGATVFHSKESRCRTFSTTCNDRKSIFGSLSRSISNEGPAAAGPERFVWLVFTTTRPRNTISI